VVPQFRSRETGRDGEKALQDPYRLLHLSAASQHGSQREELLRAPEGILFQGKKLRAPPGIPDGLLWAVESSRRGPRRLLNKGGEPRYERHGSRF